MSVPPSSDRPFDLALRESLDRRGVTLTWLHRRLRAEGHAISMATLSYWRSGQRQPEQSRSLDVVAAIEQLLDLSRGDLADSIGPARRRGPRARLAEPEDLVGSASAVPDVLGDLGFPDGWPRNLRVLSIEVTMDLDERGHEAVLTRRLALKALTDGADRFFHVVVPDEAFFGPVTFEAGGGCHVAASAVRQRAQGCALVLDRPLAAGETALVETRVHLPDTGTPSSGFIQHAPARVSDLTVWVRFHPDRTPSHCTSRVVPVDGEEVTGTVLLQGSSAHVVVTNFGPGRAGLAWGWPVDDPSSAERG